MSTGSDNYLWDDVIGEDERLVAQAYNSRRKVRAKRALLLIDLYNRAFGDAPAPLAEAMRQEPSSCGLAAWDSLPHLQRLLEAARVAAIPVIYSVSDEDTMSVGEVTLRATHGFDGKDSKPAPWGNSVHERIAPRSGEVVIKKSRASVFFGTILDAHLRQQGVESLIIVGESTSGCVRASVADAYSLGFDTVVVEEGVFDRSPLSHKMALFDMHLKYATVVSAEEALGLIHRAEPAELIPVRGGGVRDVK